MQVGPRQFQASSKDKLEIISHNTAKISKIIWLSFQYQDPLVDIERAETRKNARCQNSDMRFSIRTGIPGEASASAIWFRNRGPFDRKPCDLMTRAVTVSAATAEQTHFGMFARFGAASRSARLPTPLSFVFLSTTASSSTPSKFQLQRMAAKDLVEVIEFSQNSGYGHNSRIIWSQKTIAENKVVIFSKSWCPYCQKVKTLFAAEFPDVHPEILEYVFSSDSRT